MKKFLIFVLVILVIILADTIQAKVFNNSPILKVTEKLDNLTLDKGILVDTYISKDGRKNTVFKWEDYNDVDEENKDNENIIYDENNIDEHISYTNEELSSMALDYFMNNNDYLLSRNEYSVGISEEVPDIYQGQNLVVIEIRHINQGNNTLDARYYINIYTAKGFDDSNNIIDLTL